jgi:hypothetical protein
MKPIRLLLALLLVSAAASLAHAAEQTSVRAILVTASNEKGESDRRLAAYEPTLRRILRFESYRYVGEGSVSLAVPAKAPLPLAAGHRLELETENSSNAGIRLKLAWSEGRRVHMQTGLTLRPGVPAVLGGPRKGDGEVYAIIIIGR